jgi:uncharacterized membrane protein YidH (DUF202 family)
MGALAWVTGIVLALAFLAAGAMKLTKQAMAVEVADRLKYTNRMMPIGVAEVVGAIGVFLGLLGDDLEFIGFLAGLGLLALMLGALYYHRRGGDAPKEMAPPAVLAVLAVLYLIGLMGN